jgi:hypothetical protein
VCVVGFLLLDVVICYCSNEIMRENKVACFSILIPLQTISKHEDASSVPNHSTHCRLVGFSKISAAVLPVEDES